MNRVSKVLFIAAASLAMTGVALADEPKEGEGGGEAGGEGEAAAGGEAAAPEAAAEEASDGVITKDNWPLAAIDRPLSAAKGMLELTPQFDVTKVTEVDPVYGLEIGGRYGISDKLELLFAYRGIRLSPDSEFKGDLTVGAGFLMVGGPGKKMDLEPKIALQYDLLGETAVIAAGIDARTKLTPKIFIGTPINRPGLVLTVKGAEIAPDVTISPIFLDLPFSIGFQATPMLQLQVNTQLAHIAINDDAKLATGDTNFIGADNINLDIDATFALSTKMDVRVGLNFGDMKNAGDLIAIAAGINFRL